MKVSIVIATYNREAYILEAINSCLSQYGCEFAVIVVDDGSTDGTRELLESITNTRVRTVFCRHRGVSCARNRAVQEADGEFTLVLDSDDFLLPGALKPTFVTLFR